MFNFQKSGWQSTESPVVTRSRPQLRKRGPRISLLSIACFSVTSILCIVPAPTAPVYPERRSNSAFLAAMSAR